MPTRNDDLSRGSWFLSFSNPLRSIEQQRENIFSPCSPIPHTSNFSLEISIPTTRLITRLPWYYEKSRDRLGPILFGHKGSKSPINLSWLQGAGGQTVLRVRRPRK